MTEPTKEQMDTWWLQSRCNVPVKYMAMTLAYVAGFSEGRKHQYPRLSERSGPVVQNSPQDPTLDQVDQWWDQAMDGPETPFSSTHYVARRAAAWAREQAMEDAAEVCERMSHDIGHDDDEPSCWECADAIRALKNQPKENQDDHQQN